jgi:predicted RNase H-like nuclease
MRRGPELPYELLAGVVPCPAGWVAATGKLVGTQVHVEEPTVFKTFREVLDHVPKFKIVTVTLPIGLPTSPRRRGRTADRLARQLLGFPHAGAIGSTPTRRALSKPNYDAARAANGGLLDVVTWQQFKRIRELDETMEPYLQRQVFEVRAELAFYQLNENTALKFTKSSARGRVEREELVRHRLPGAERVVDVPLKRVRPSHLVDAVGALWAARRIASRAAVRMPDEPEWDDRSLRMEILY